MIVYLIIYGPHVNFGSAYCICVPHAIWICVFLGKFNDMSTSWLQTWLFFQKPIKFFPTVIETDISRFCWSRLAFYIHFFYCLSIGFYWCHGHSSINKIFTKNCNKRISRILILYTQFCLFLSPLRKARCGCTTQSNAHF